MDADERRREGHARGRDLFLGMSLGVALGLALDNMPIGLCLGLTLSLASGPPPGCCGKTPAIKPIEPEHPLA